jgi:hypothetical protein
LGPCGSKEKVDVQGDVEVIVFETQEEGEVKGSHQGC